MLAKWKIELVSFLSSLSMISVGFSAWNLSSSIPVIETVNGTVQTDYVVKTDNYVYFSKDDSKDTDDGIILPQYNAGGFIVKDSEGNGYVSSSVGDMILYFAINVKKIKENYPFSNSDNYLHIECNIALYDSKNVLQTAFFNFAEEDVTEDVISAETTIKNTQNTIMRRITKTPKSSSGYTQYFLQICNLSMTEITTSESNVLFYAVKITTDAQDKTKVKSALENANGKYRFVFNAKVFSSENTINLFA